MKSSQEWIKQLNLIPHPEGGYYRRIYTGHQTCPTDNGNRGSASAIHYLLESGDYSSWHRIKQDEIWFFHTGSPLTVHQLNDKGELLSTVLSQSDHISLTVTANTWFCAELTAKYNEEYRNSVSELTYALVSCVVTPEFDFSDFELGSKVKLIEQYPQHVDAIHRLCREK